MRKYPSKLLLFGEHVLLLGGSALAVPVKQFCGVLVADNDSTVVPEFRDRLLAFAQSPQLRDVPGLDATAFEKDLERGLRFDSNIPMGYGLGSSGALCAAVYDRYCFEKTEDLSRLKALFAQMESFFHGSSSGIDPLTSYLDRPLLIRNKTEVELATLADWPDAPPEVFLLDSRLPRSTGPLVEWFLAQIKEPAFARFLEEDYLPAHENLVAGWLEADAPRFWHNLRQVSRFQLEKFIPMVPPEIREIWVECIENQKVVLKICGAGGGGYFLGFCQSPEDASFLKSKFDIVYPFQS